ncbi:MAG: DUF1266 domain-containing protein [Candidatus Auribacterota bacterium]
MNSPINYLSLTLLLFLTGCTQNIYTDQQKAWSLATTALLSEVNWEEHTTLAGEEQSSDDILKQKEDLQEWWGIYNRSDLLDTLSYLEYYGHSRKYDEIAANISTSETILKGITLQQVDNDIQEAENRLSVVKQYYKELGDKRLTAWDYCRYIHLCRKGYLIGYLRESEAWGKIMPIARKLQKTYTSWKELGKHYLIGRQFWSYEYTQKKGIQFQGAYVDLLTDPQSPWTTIPWDLDLHPQEVSNKEAEQAPTRNKNYTDSIIIYKEAVTLRRNNRNMEALKAYDDAIKLDPNNYRAWNERGLIFEKWADWEEALKSHEKAVTINPGFALGWTNKGYVLGELNRDSEALQAHETALDIQPDFPLALSNKGYILSKMNRSDEALACQEKALHILPDYPLALYNRACLLALKGRTNDALTDLRKATVLDANFKNIALHDEDFASLHNHPDFIELMK